MSNRTEELARERVRNPGRRGFLAAVGLGGIAVTGKIIPLGDPVPQDARPTSLDTTPRIRAQLYPDGTVLEWIGVVWVKTQSAWIYTAKPIDITKAGEPKGVLVRWETKVWKCPFHHSIYVVNGDQLKINYTLQQNPIGQIV